MTIEVTSGVMATLREEAACAAPLECCGLLLGGPPDGIGHGARIERAMPAANVSPEPAIRFEIDPLTLLAAHKAARGGGAAVVGYYHSHPTGHPLPSATDCEHSTGDLRVWGIVASGEVAFFRDTADGFTPLSYRVIES
jgi:proteasome lid subunit RPN8/RPN11